MYWRYIHSPAYTFTRVREAMTQHDLESFEERVDLDSFASALVDDIVTAMISKVKRDSQDGWSGLGAGLAEGFIQLMKPQMVSAFKSSVKTSIEHGDPEQLKESKGMIPQLIPAKGTSGIASVEELGRQGKIAFVRITLTDDSGLPKGTHFDFRLRQRPSGWQIIGLSNTKELISTLAGTKR